LPTCAAMSTSGTTSLLRVARGSGGSAQHIVYAQMTHVLLHYDTILPRSLSHICPV
jgi:hypothetical protein